MGNTIRTTMDAAGRLVIPKPIRQRAGLRPGQPLEVTLHDGRVEIEPAPVSVRIETKGRVAVAVPEEPLPTLTGDEVDATRRRVRARGEPEELVATAVYSSVLIAAVSSWHEDHERCLRALDSLLAEPPVVLPQHAVIESYSVLTRLPAPHRLAPETAHALLERTLSGVTEIAALPPGATWPFLADLSDTATAGGAVYEALILRGAAAAGADRILTLNPRHFERLVQAEVEVVEP